MVSILPVIGHTRVAEDEFDQVCEACFRTNIVGENQEAALTILNAYHGVRRLAVVTAFVEAVPLRTVKDDDAQPGGKILALLTERHIGLEYREQTGSRNVQAWLCDFDARCSTQAVPPYESGSEL